MRTQDDRDVVTLNIVTSLLIFAGVTAVGALPLVLMDRLVGGGVLLSAMGHTVVGCAFVVALTYLWRHRKP